MTVTCGGLVFFSTSKIDHMSTQAEPEEILTDGIVTLDMDPDVVVLGKYLSAKREMTLSQFVEYLITKEAANGK